MARIINHLLVQEKLTQIRREGIDSIHFRAGMIEIGRLLAYELANTLEKEIITVKTPLGIAKGLKIKGKDQIVIINVLRAAIPMVEGIMRVFKEGEYGVVGAWRKEKVPFPVVVGYCKLPALNNKTVIVADPMLATGNTMNAILAQIKEYGTPRRLIMLNIIASKSGMESVEHQHPDIEIFTCAVDKELNKEGYIVPGLGDAGDIAFGKPFG